MEATLVEWLKEYGYIVLFFWSMLEGETGLVMAGVLSHTGDMNVPMSIAIASLGGFIGDQIYFYLGVYNKSYVHREFSQHRRKFAKARLMLRKYGAWVIFFQRFIYGMRTIIPLAIGMSSYNRKKFAIVNFISAVVWASLTIIPAYIFGEEILKAVVWMKEHWYFAVLFAISIVGTLYYISAKEDKK